MAWIVDSGYRAEDENGLTLALRNLGQEILHFEVGDRVAQGLFVPVWTPDLIGISEEEIDETERGGARLGSSGIK
jgi:dUTPase